MTFLPYNIGVNNVIETIDIVIETIGIVIETIELVIEVIMDDIICRIAVDC